MSNQTSEQMTEQEAFDAWWQNVGSGSKSLDRRAWKAALDWAAHGQEPVAWILQCPSQTGLLHYKLSWSRSGAGVCMRLSGEENETPLYTHPAPAVAQEPVAESDLAYSQGIQDAANMLDTKADDYAKEFGFDDMGALEFRRESQREYHSTLVELAEEVRSMTTTKPAPAVAVNEQVLDALKNVTVHLISAHSLLKQGGKKAVASDTMFNTMLIDYQKSFEDGRSAIAAAEAAKKGGAA